LEHTVQKRRTKENLGAGLNLKILNPVAGGGDIKFGKDSEYDETKESYIGIQALPENDHWIRWMWHTYGNSVGPLKEITLMVSIGLPKEKNISQLKASFEAHAKYFERSTIVGNIGRFIMGESAESHTGSFQVTVHFKDVSVTQKPEVVVPVGGGGIERSIGVSLLFLLLASVILFTVVV
jgi:hypothetical protein